MTDSDEELIERLRQAHSVAFEQLFLRHYSQVYWVVYGLVGNHEEPRIWRRRPF